MHWALTFVLCVALVETFLLLPVMGVVSEMTRVVKRVAHVVRAPGISDHWKEKVMLAYARGIFAGSLKLAIFLVGIVAVAVAIVLAFDAVSSGFEAFVVSGPGILASVAFATAYAVARTKFFHG